MVDESGVVFDPNEHALELQTQESQVDVKRVYPFRRFGRKIKYFNPSCIILRYKYEIAHEHTECMSGII